MTTVAGDAAVQPFTWAPAQVCRRIAARSFTGPPRTPSMDTIWSPGLRKVAAGVPLATPATALVGTTTCWPWEYSSAQAIPKAMRMFTAGPARMVTTRFHTGWL